MEIKSIGVTVSQLQKPSENQSNKTTPRKQAVNDASPVPERDASTSNGLILDIEPTMEVHKALFSVDDEGNTIIKIIDPEGELVKQIPPEKFLEAAAALRESFGDILDLEA